MTATGAGSTARAEPPAELVARFEEAPDRLWPEGGKLGLAVSGGPDSMAMLLLAQAAVPGKFEVATVDHGLRPEARDECELVLAACEARGISCEVLPVEVGEGNVQAQARRARYLALEAWALRRGLPAIATAHHADDQAETLVMRLNRGSGLTGLAGVRPRASIPGARLALLRPLLRWQRAELAAIVAGAGLEPAQDPSNADDAYDRVRIRKALAKADWLDAEAVAASAGHLADADEAIGWIVERVWDEAVIVAEGGIRYLPGEPRAVALRIVTRIVEGFGGSPRGGAIARLVADLDNGTGGNVAGVAASVEDGAWLFRPESPRRSG